MDLDFPVSSEDCRLLLLLEETGSIKLAATRLRRDVSVVSRQVARMGGRNGLVEKIDGRWQVSETGKRVNAWARDAILSQKRVLAARSMIRIATTREFAARVLGPALPGLMEGSNALLTLHTPESGVEKSLLLGEADIGLDCGRPRDPLIRFQRIAPEPFAIAAAPARARRISSKEGLLTEPHLQYSRLSAPRLLGLSVEIPGIAAVFSDLGAMRSACEAGLGWAIFPRYVIRAELEKGSLAEIRLPRVRLEPEQFGVWWLRERQAMDPWVALFSGWLKKQAL